MQEELTRLDQNTVAVITWYHCFNISEDQAEKMYNKDNNATIDLPGYVWEIRFYHLNQPGVLGFILNDAATAKLLAAIVKIKSNIKATPVAEYWA